ncbi:MAG: PHP domain-containing protein [bacterium]|nr:PHP domain-containing protein [bacterium]
MYVFFFPASNFLKDFKPGNRTIWNLQKGRKVSDVIGLLKKVYRIQGHTSSHNENEFSFVLGTLDELPECIKNKLNEDFWRISPSSFIYLLNISGKSAIWIGGKDNQGFFSTLVFLERTLCFLTQKYLLAADFHIHTTLSDGELKPLDVFSMAIRAGLDAVAITDHNTASGAQIVRKHSQGALLVLTGQEIKDNEETHLLILGHNSGIRNNSDPDLILKKWLSGNNIIIQAHPTSSKYFVNKDKRAFGVEAFNFASSAPEKGRNYARQMLKQNRCIPILGVSDCHLAEDIGMARTYLRTARLNIKDILSEVSKGRTAAFYRGIFFGSKNLCASLRYIYRHSNLLSGKLVPLSLQKSNSLFKIDESRCHWQTLKVSAFHPEQRLFCDGKNCDCKETWFRITQIRPVAMKFGEQMAVVLRINNNCFPIALHPGIDSDISPFLHYGKNTIEIEELAAQKFSPRICIGREIKNWEIKTGNGKWKKVQAGSNLQVLGLVPIHYKGEVIYRTYLTVPKSEGDPALFFDGTDGNIEIFVNGQTILRRSNAHWWDRYEVSLPKESMLEIVVRIFNERGNCGITNRVFIGNIITTGNSGIIKFELEKDMRNLQVIRCAESRVRAILCNNKGKICRTVLAGSLLHPFFITKSDSVAWVVLNSFEDPLPMYQPMVAYIGKIK